MKLIGRGGARFVVFFSSHFISTTEPSVLNFSDVPSAVIWCLCMSVYLTLGLTIIHYMLQRCKKKYMQPSQKVEHQSE